jgi:hypothetical protein
MTSCPGLMSVHRISGLYWKSVCDMTEKGMKIMTSVAVTSALPITRKLEPQIVVAKTNVCWGRDRPEERLTILNQSIGCCQPVPPSHSERARKKKKS